MVKLDVSLIRYMTADEVRILTSVEMGMRNHELVPKTLINTISGLRNGGISKILLKLTQNKLLSYERGKRFDGYRLTYKGYDFLALNVLSNRNVLTSIGNQIGVGKESDVYVGGNSEGKSFAVKLHRLGRTCFRTVSTKRDYQKSGHKTNWIYLSRLAAKRELAFMRLLYDNKVAIPEPIDCNRHCLVMELIDGILLNHLSREDIKQKEDIEALYENLMNLIIRLANEFGVIHGDFNEFNILVKNQSFDPILIDFPQMISISHSSAQIYFDRDVKCIVDFFAKRFGFESDFIPCFEVIDKQNDIITEINELNIEEDEEDSDVDNNVITKNMKIKTKKTGLAVTEEVVPKETTVGETKVEEFIDISETKPKTVDTTELKPELEESSELTTDVGDVDHNESEITSKDSTIERKSNSLTKFKEKYLSDKIERIEIKDNSNSEDSGSETGSFRAVSSVASTFTTEQIKEKLQKERKRNEFKSKIKNSRKNIKGDNSAFARKRKDDLAILKDDIKTYHSDKDLFK